MVSNMLYKHCLQGQNLIWFSESFITNKTDKNNNTDLKCPWIHLLISFLKGLCTVIHLVIPTAQHKQNKMWNWNKDLCTSDIVVHLQITPQYTAVLNCCTLFLTTLYFPRPSYATVWSVESTPPQPTLSSSTQHLSGGGGDAGGGARGDSGGGVGVGVQYAFPFSRTIRWVFHSWEQLNYLGD